MPGILSDDSDKSVDLSQEEGEENDNANLNEQIEESKNRNGLAIEATV